MVGETSTIKDSGDVLLKNNEFLFGKKVSKRKIWHLTIIFNFNLDHQWHKAFNTIYYINFIAW